MRFVGRFLALVVLLAALAWPSADAARPLKLDDASRRAKEFVGFVGDPESARLARLDETSLRTLRPRSAPLGSVDAWAFSPDGAQIAVAVHPRGAGGPWRDTIRLVDLRTLRFVRKPISLNGEARALLWSRPDRIAALVMTAADAPAIATVDTSARRILSSKPLDGSVSAITRVQDALVVLETPDNAIGVSKLAVVDAAGLAHVVSLERITGGMEWPQDPAGDRIGTQRRPALTVDPAQDRAYVVQPDGPAAEVDLRTLTVSYHDLTAPSSVLARLAAWLQPNAQAKGLNGPERTARWLGNGLIAVTGNDEHATMDLSQLTISSTPAGLAIVDAHDWSVRMLDRGADSVAVAAGALLATGRTWSSASQETHGMGLAVYGIDRALRFRLWPGTSAWVQAVWAGRAYIAVTSGNASRTFVVDLVAGTVVGERMAAVPVPLLGDGPDS